MIIHFNLGIIDIEYELVRILLFLKLRLIFLDHVAQSAVLFQTYWGGLFYFRDDMSEYFFLLSIYCGT